MAQVHAEWAHPTGPHFVEGDRQLTGPVRILYAGSTPDGPAAVIAQKTSVAFIGIYVGVMTTQDHHLVLWGPNDPFEPSGDSSNAGRFSDQQVSFVSGPSGRLIVLPVDSADTASVSFSHSDNSQL